ncbi:MAG: pyruvate carboxylase [Gammaproteobacteria bacterium]|nr:pyruvate carboxylase [Gammaproteobacteria bacterium]MBI5617468.1 pyruvate carboxylase [Gammaproteobacteria bacterium]
MRTIKKILIANRGEIAIRVMRAAAELDIESVAIYSQEDRFSLHRFKVDESWLVGQGKTPVQAYLDADDIIRIALESGAEAIHPGYGFLSERPEFAQACADAGIVFVGPPPEVMRMLGNKVAARELAERCGVPLMPATGPLPDDRSEILRLAQGIGFPVMLKASWGGGGRGMRVIEDESTLFELVDLGRREAETAFGNGEVYLEKLIRNARHVEVQIIGDRHGNLVHLFDRDCTVQRRNQKVVERAPATFLTEDRRAEICAAAVTLCRTAGYQNAGTVEFLQDADTGAVYFIEVNPRVQVEHTVTEEITGIDIVKAQIRIALGAAIGTEECGVPRQEDIRCNGYALQCRVTTEDPENNFIPDYGTITAYRSPAGFGIRLDAGTAYTGAQITRYYDSLLVKVTAWGGTPPEATSRMLRALREFRVRGVVTNLRFLEGLLEHPDFTSARYTTTFIDRTPELFNLRHRQDYASPILTWVGEVIVNGNEAVKGRAKPDPLRIPRVPATAGGTPRPGTRQKLDELGAKGFAEWMLAQPQALLTDTTFRDAHQSLLATRMRSYDMLAIAPAYAELMPDLFSIECWGGATFDVAMRFLYECPWERLRLLREKLPNMLLQMLLRSANGVGYKNYPDNAVVYFVEQAAANGIDVFRIFDSLNWVENMRMAIDAVVATGKLAEAAICYTGNLSDPKCTKYDLNYYVGMAKELERAGAHIIGIKDMAGLCRPAAARDLVHALKNDIALPIHFHTHDTSGISAASVLAALEAGCDAADAAMDSMSGLTSQPNLGSIVEALRHGPRDSGLDPDTIRRLSTYWEEVRSCYTAFESDIRSGASEVYVHGMPGGQYTNLREQARSLGISDHWPDVAKAYADVNDMFGDIVKVTPSSKVVGDMALMMVTSGLSREDVENPAKDIAFPESVVSFFKGDLGQPYGGFPPALQAKILQGEAPLTERPGAVLPPLDLAAVRAEAERKVDRPITEAELASYLMYPAVFVDYAKAQRTYGDLTGLPTPVFFYGMESGREITVLLERGKTMIVRYVGTSDIHDDNHRTVFFELNGQPRPIKVVDRTRAITRPVQAKAEPGNASHVGAPMPGVITQINVDVGSRVSRGETLATLEAMKMQTSIRAEQEGTVKQVCVGIGHQVDAKDLLMIIE